MFKKNCVILLNVLNIEYVVVKFLNNTCFAYYYCLYKYSYCHIHGNPLNIPRISGIL